MAFFIMKVGLQDSFYVAGIAAVASIMANLSQDVLVDCLYDSKDGQEQQD